ncbi:type IV secretion system protein [Piscinibacter koreensis]|uniref:Type IV secretion system protein n=1 Tax=Piscinibacter koreensis TaxID=2742824 RepID=A0A7Y6NTC8_9BURK|nr:type IV secretion system protein [Schlegelella koreensis]NUZ08979.1 type IV secretion system protein [Schlegelella koreensis]
MFAWVGSKFDAILSTYVLGVVSTLMTALSPIALVAMTIWVTLYGWAVLRNEVPESLQVFVWKVFKIGIVLAFALQSGFYTSNVSDTANALAMGVASTFVPAGVDPTTITGPYALLDRFNDDASAQVADIMKEAGITRLDLFLAAAIFSIGSVVFLCIGLFVVTLSKLFLTFVIAVGPLFILCLAWRPTARFFDSWLSMVLNSVVLTWFAFFALGLSTYMGAAIFDAIADGGGFLGGTFNVLGEATRYCVLMILMAIICFQAPSLASALTGGAAVQQGIQMIQNAMMVSGLRSARAGTSAAGTAGGVVRAGAGLPYAAGVATGSAAAAGGRFAGSMATGAAAMARQGYTGAAAMARQGYAAARVAAYRLAALRGTA